jgi:hypothetical protein
MRGFPDVCVKENLCSRGYSPSRRLHWRFVHGIRKSTKGCVMCDGLNHLVQQGNWRVDGSPKYLFKKYPAVALTRRAFQVGRFGVRGVGCGFCFAFMAQDEWGHLEESLDAATGRGNGRIQVPQKRFHSPFARKRIDQRLTSD